MQNRKKTHIYRKLLDDYDQEEKIDNNLFELE